VFTAGGVGIIGTYGPTDAFELAFAAALALVAFEGTVALLEALLILEGKQLASHYCWYIVALMKYSSMLMYL